MEIQIKKIKEYVRLLDVNLKDLRILTEVGSGDFLWTPIIAGLAGASKVVCVSKDSKWGKFCEISQRLEKITQALGLSEVITCREDDAIHFVPNSDIITNLGFVRPINQRIIDQMNTSAVVSLMVEPWEVRQEDVDLAYLKKKNIPFCGTNEKHPLLSIFSYVGILSVKLLLERNFGVYNNNILLISSPPYSTYIKKNLKALGANVTLYNVFKGVNFQEKDFDCIILAEQKAKSDLWPFFNAEIKKLILSKTIPLLHIVGCINEKICQELGNYKYPSIYVSPQVMTLTTSYVGAEPVIALHAGGLKAGELLWRAYQQSNDVKIATKIARESGFAL